MPCILFSFGYNDLPVGELGGDVVIDRYGQLTATISDLAASCRAAAESL